MYKRCINVFSNNNNISCARVFIRHITSVYTVRAYSVFFFPFTGFDLMYQRARLEAPDYKHIALYRANGHGY
jgi:hypothetical protein